MKTSMLEAMHEQTERMIKNISSKTQEILSQKVSQFELKA